MSHTIKRPSEESGGEVATQRFCVESGREHFFVWPSGRWGNKIIHAEPSSWGRVSTQEDEQGEIGWKKADSRIDILPVPCTINMQINHKFHPLHIIRPHSEQ